MMMFCSGILRTLHALYNSSFRCRPFCRKFPLDMHSRKMFDLGTVVNVDEAVAPPVMLRMVGPKNIVSSSGCDVT